MKLSIIIVNYNVKYYLEQCLNSILTSHITYTYEIIIVDNNSTDESLSYLKNKFERYTNIVFIKNSENVGFAKANNQAIELSKGEYILLLNPDTVLGEHVLANVSKFIDGNPTVGAVGVKAINGLGQFLPESKRGFPTPWASFCKLSGLESLFPYSKIFGQYSLRFLDENKPHKVPILVGAFMMIRREAITKAGLLDEDFFMYGEDIDLSYRIMKAGFENYYLPEKIIHYKGESTDKNNKKYTEAFYEAMRIFFKKHYPNYGILFSGIISVGINLKSLINPFSKNINKEYSETKTFSTLNYNYETIIDKMDIDKNKNTQFRIFNPDTQLTIGSQYVNTVN